MKTYCKYIFAALVMASAMTSCSNSIDPSVLDQPESISLPEGVALDDNLLFGEWEAQSAMGSTNRTHFEQSYHVSFQSVTDGTAQISHWFTDAITEMRDSTKNYQYSYSFDGKNITLTPTPEYALKGANVIKGRSIGNEQILLYTDYEGVLNSVCTLHRVSNPVAAITSVDRTLPQAGETITLTGRNLQFLTSVSLPVKDGWVDVVPKEIGSKMLKVVVPAGNTYVAGAIRGNGSDGHDCYSPAYMFCYDNVFFKDFIVKGTSSNKYAGSEFEYTISSMGTLKDHVKEYGKSAIPDGHTAKDVANTPDNLLSFFGGTPIAWPLATKTDDKKGYLRFSSGDRFQYVLDHCGGNITANTKCVDLAIQMDIYVSTDGEAKWDTGYLSWRLNKDQSALTSEMGANVAMWDKDNPTSFTEGWKTFTIPLSKFAIATKRGTIGELISYLKTNNLQSILTLINWPLDDLHPVHACSTIQFSMANIRLVNYKE